MRNLIALFTLLCSSNATAMSCIVPSLEERYREHNHIALVEVTGAQLEESEEFSRSAPFAPEDSIETTDERKETKLLEPARQRVVVTIRVLESYKGESPPTRLVLAGRGEHPEVTVGAMYLVFLNGSDVSQACDGMPMVSEANPEDARVIGALRALKETANEQSR